MEINKNFNNEKSVNEKLSEKERATCYLYCDPDILFIVLNYHFLIESL